MTHTPTLTDQRSAVRRLIEASVLGDRETVEQLVTDDVVGWSPTINVHSRKELLAEFADRHGAFSDVTVTVDHVDANRDHMAAEWRMTAHFTGSLEIEELTIPPTGRTVVLAGATFAEMRGDRVQSFRHYFDDAALLEQLVVLE